jgi:hypothetical protein
MIHTKERLAQVLHAEALFDLERKARAGDFDDYESESATPIVDLVMTLERLGKHKLADRARNGEFDGSKGEAEAWAKREGFSSEDQQKS